MRVDVHHRGGVLIVRVSERAVVVRPDWDAALASVRPDTALVVLDLEEVEFMSRPFLHACVELDRQLAGAGQRLALLHLSTHQAQLLEAVEGAFRLAILDSEDELSSHLPPNACAEVPAPAGGGLTTDEKSFLWD